MWLIDAFQSAFEFPTQEWRIQVFRLILSTACILKSIEAIRHGGWNRFSYDGFERFRLAAYRPRSSRAIIQSYKPVLVARLAGSFGLLWGPPLPLWTAILVVSLIVELGYEFRFHSVYMIALLTALNTAGNSGIGWELSDAESYENTWCQVLIVIITSHLYINSAWKKARSRQFRSGRLLAQFVKVNTELEPRLRYREFWYPRMVKRLLGNGDSDAVARWRVLSATAIVAELVLPVALLWSVSYPYASVVGLAMHIPFTALLPRRILPFTIATVATYILFQP